MRELIKTVTVCPEEGSQEPFYLDYYLLGKELRLEDTCVNRFGIEIYKRARRADGTRYAEYRKIFDIFHTEGETIEAIELMARNTVTPIALKDVLEDMLGVAEFADEGLLMAAV